MHNWKEQIYFPNTDMPESDEAFLREILSTELTTKGRAFFEKMREKERGEFAPSADLILDERSNEDEIFIVRYYFNEYKLGKGLVGHRHQESIYEDTLAALMQTSMAPFIQEDITLLEWLVRTDFKGIKFDGNYAIH